MTNKYCKTYKEVFESIITKKGGIFSFIWTFNPITIKVSYDDKKYKMIYESEWDVIKYNKLFNIETLLTWFTQKIQFFEELARFLDTNWFKTKEMLTVLLREEYAKEIDDLSNSPEELFLKNNKNQDFMDVFIELGFDKNILLSVLWNSNNFINNLTGIWSTYGLNRFKVDNGLWVSWNVLSPYTWNLKMTDFENVYYKIENKPFYKTIFEWKNWMYRRDLVEKLNYIQQEQLIYVLMYLSWNYNERYFSGLNQEKFESFLKTFLLI